jgi:hypothetical protein
MKKAAFSVKDTAMAVGPAFVSLAEMESLEKLLLGHILITGSIPECIDETLFAAENSRIIFNAIQETVHAGRIPDMVTVSKRLRETGYTDNIALLATLATDAPLPSRIPEYVRILQGYQDQRKAEYLLKDALEDLSKGLPIEDIQDRLTTGLAGITETRQPARKTLWTAAELANHEFPALRFIVDRLIPTGLSVIAGAPKLGKSWLSLSIALAVANGGNVFGRPEKVQKAGVLYLALEDTGRRLKERLAKLNAGYPEGLVIQTENPGLAWLTGYLTAHREIKLCIIDTWIEFAKGLRDANSYKETTAYASALKRLADDLDIAIVCVHHTRKGQKGGDADWVDSLMGSQGLAGKADTIIKLARGRGNRDAELTATGRDIEEVEWVMSFDKDLCTWAYIGDKAEVLAGNAQQSILDWLKENGPHSPKTIFEGLQKEGASISYGAVRQRLMKMLDQNILQKEGAQYGIISKQQ